MAAGIRRVHIWIHGDVTGVGFRAWMVGEANKLGLTGWVRNADRGRVEAVVYGEKEMVEKMIKLSRKGPQTAWVEKLEVTDERLDESLKTFDVR